MATGSLFARCREGAEALSAGVSSRALALLQAVFVLALVFAPGVSLWAVPPLALMGALVVRPWRAPRARRCVAALGIVVAALGAGVPAVDGPPRRVGLGLDPAAADGLPSINQVYPGFPAEGRLRVGDRVVGVEGRPLDTRAPVADLAKRVQAAGDALHFDVVRGGEPLAIDVPVPGAPAPGPAAKLAAFARERILLANVVRAVFVIVVVLLLLWAEGLGLASIGISRAGLVADLRMTPAVTALCFGVHMAASIVLAAIATPLGLFGEKDARARMGAIGEIVGDTPIAAVAVAMVVTSLFEEVAFRGFILPRLVRGLRSWVAGLTVASLLFGAGHLYEGGLAVGQTAVLGLSFGAAFLYTRRLLPVVIAHAIFNTVMLVMMRIALASGALQRLLE